MHTYKAAKVHKGSTDLERRDRAIGALLTVIGIVAVANLPEARAQAAFMDSNAFGAVFMYQLLFGLAFLVVIGPSIMLPHRAGVMPLAMACLFAYLQFQAEFDTTAKQKRIAEQAVQVSPARNSLGG